MTPAPDDVDRDVLDRLDGVDGESAGDRHQKTMDEHCRRCGAQLHPGHGEIGGGAWKATYAVCPNCRTTGKGAAAFITVSDDDWPDRTQQRLERSRSKAATLPSTVAAYLSIAPPGDYEVWQLNTVTWLVIPVEGGTEDDVVDCYPSDKWATDQTQRDEGVVIYPTDVTMHGAREN